jgi:hypothetical protein
MKHIVVASLAGALALSAAFTACSDSSARNAPPASVDTAAARAPAVAPAATPAATAATAAPDSTTWTPLFDSTMSAWRGYKEQKMPSGWTYKDGVVSKTVSTNDIITKDQYANFELTFDWLLHKGGNAGVFYRGDESGEKIYMTGPEYQLLDDAGHPDGKSRLTAAGSDYALYPSPAGIVKPADQWNSSRIVVRGNHVEHWLNGTKTVEYEFGSPDWQKRLAASKFAKAPKYGVLPTGHIGIQGDHEGPLSIRSMRIRVLP